MLLRYFNLQHEIYEMIKEWWKMCQWCIKAFNVFIRICKEISRTVFAFDAHSENECLWKSNEFHVTYFENVNFQVLEVLLNVSACVTQIMLLFVWSSMFQYIFFFTKKPAINLKLSYCYTSNQLWWMTIIYYPLNDIYV